MAHQRPRCDLVQCDGQGLLSESENVNWVQMISCVAGFPSEIVGFPPKLTKFFFLSVQCFFASLKSPYLNLSIILNTIRPLSYDQKS